MATYGSHVFLCDNVQPLLQYCNNILQCMCISFILFKETPYMVITLHTTHIMASQLKSFHLTVNLSYVAMAWYAYALPIRMCIQDSYSSLTQSIGIGVRHVVLGFFSA